MKKFSDFVADTKGEPDAMDSVITIFIALILAGTLGVAAFGLLANANWSGVDSSVKLIASTVLSIIAAIGIFLVVLRVARGKK